VALIECSECNHEVSDQAASCPHCGARLALPASSRTTHGKVAGSATTREDVQIGGALLFVGLIVYLLGRLFGCCGNEKRS
jgi:hypothetical protein